MNSKAAQNCSLGFTFVSSRQKFSEMQRVYNIGLMIEPLSGYGEKMLTGISRFSQEKSNWRIAFFDREHRELVDLLANWQGDGIICTAVGDDFAAAARGREIPMINVTSRQDDEAFVHVVGEEFATGEMAGDYLLGRGFQSFAVVRKSLDARFANDRVAGFEKKLTAAGFSLPVYRDGAEEEELGAWLAKLPRPLAVLGVTDRMAARAMEACWEQELRVPEEVAVMGLGNYDQLCDLCSPTLTSVEVGMERRGFEAARLLAHILESGEKPPARTMIPPVEVIERRSTDVYAFEDIEVVAALRFIRENAHHTIKVSDVVAVTSISRRSLEGRFTKIIGQTIHEEIWRAHFDMATRMLSFTDFSLKEVAEKSGFRTASALVTLFRNRFQLTPKEYRLANRR